MPKKRVLAAIMFTDITGFSAMMQSDEAKAAITRNRHRTVFKSTHEKYEGKILQYFGDGTLSIFESVSAAVECAVEMQIEFRKEPEVPLRIGIHAGDIVYDEEGAYGNSMNIASRVENICIPGAVYVTAKVFDDIRNHRWLTAAHLGDFNLRNISEPQQIYAITSKGLIIPNEEELKNYPEYNKSDSQEQSDLQEPEGKRRKGVAVLLALFFGVFGVHRMYLGKRGTGIAMLVMTIITLIATIEEDTPLIAIMGILAFVDTLLLLAMPKQAFHQKYNGGPIAKKVRKKRKAAEKVADPTQQNFDAGLYFYKDGKIHNAIREFDKVLEANPRDGLTHFYLARCFSVLNDKQDSFFHLERAVQFGFSDFDWIEKDRALKFLIAQPEYKRFKANNYRRVVELPPPEEDLLSQLAGKGSNSLEKIELLGDEMEKGKITRQQFDELKKRILNGE